MKPRADRPVLRPSPRWPRVLAVVAALVAAGCNRDPGADARREREADLAAAEADFAANVRDWSRAEAALGRAASLAPGRPNLWLELGKVRVRQGNAAGGRDAYTRALEGFERVADSAAAKGNPEATIFQIRVLLLLGRAPEARAVAAELPRRFPGNSRVREYIDGKEWERLPAEPSFREVALPAAGR